MVKVRSSTRLEPLCAQSTVDPVWCAPGVARSVSSMIEGGTDDCGSVRRVCYLVGGQVLRLAGAVGRLILAGRWSGVKLGGRRLINYCAIEFAPRTSPADVLRRGLLSIHDDVSRKGCDHPTFG